MKRPPSRIAAHRGFTLIEVMITVAIVAILASVAYPSYRDYIIRGRLVDATNGLTAVQADMERHFQDNRTYASVAAAPPVPAFPSPCAANPTFGQQPNHFIVACSAGPTATTYTLTATGQGAMAGYAFTLNQARQQTTTTNGTTRPGWGAATPNSCWVVRRGQTCG